MKQFLLIGFFIGFALSMQGQIRLNVQFSKEGGFYNKTIRVKLYAPLGASIYYTIDGSSPSSKSIKYSTGSPVTINRTGILQAIAIRKKVKSRIYTQTYIIREKSGYPIISMAINPRILHSRTRGWLHKGPRADSIYPYYNANFWSRKEVTGNIEIYEPNREMEFNGPVGIRLFGGMSRLFPQKSFAIACRSSYGDRHVSHRLFPHKKHKKYKHFILRNSGSDNGKTHFRDAMITSLVEDLDIEKQAYRPALLFVNGDYWGIYNIREKVNRHFIDYNCDVHKDSIDLVEHQKSLKRGSMGHYNRMISFMERHDLVNKSDYEYVKTLMDIDNFMNYQIIQIYADNKDAGGNIKFWRPRTVKGRWRWILYDTDFGFGLQKKNAYASNSLEFHTDPDGPAWPNPPWSTFILRKLLENKEFEKAFINRFSDHLNSIFKPEVVVTRIDSMQGQLDPEINRHLKRWKFGKKTWERQCDVMRNFAEKRPKYIRQFLTKKFKLGPVLDLKMKIKGGGRIVINDNLEIGEHEFEGQYFQGIPVKLKALPNYGCQFSHWEGIDSKASIIALDIKKITQITAVFKKSTHPMGGRIIFNEINCNNLVAEDWVEIYNTTKDEVNLKDWIFRDNNHDFKLPHYILKGQDFVVICRDTSSYFKLFSKRRNVIGNIPFGISKKKERLELYSKNGASIDSLSYELETIDSAFTMVLKLPSLDNSDTTNWNIVYGSGTPARDNPQVIKQLKAKVKRKKRNELLFLGGVFILLLLGSAFLIQKMQQPMEE